MSSNGVASVNGIIPAPHEAKPTRDVSYLLDEIASNGKSLTQGNSKARKNALNAARELCFALETPVEAIIRICWAQVSFLPPRNRDFVNLRFANEKPACTVCYGPNRHWFETV